jgi:hypothetical protein
LKIESQPDFENPLGSVSDFENLPYLFICVLYTYKVYNMIYGVQQKLVINYICDITHFLWYTMKTSTRYIDFIYRGEKETKNQLIRRILTGEDVQVDLRNIEWCGDFIAIVNRYKKLISKTDIRRDVYRNPVAFSGIYNRCEEIDVALQLLLGCNKLEMYTLLNIPLDCKSVSSPERLKLIYHKYTREVY